MIKLLHGLSGLYEYNVSPDGIETCILEEHRRHISKQIWVARVRESDLLLIIDSDFTYWSLALNSIEVYCKPTGKKLTFVECNQKKVRSALSDAILQII